MSQVTIPDLPAGGVLLGTELLEISNSNVTQSTTAAAIVTLSNTWTGDQVAQGFDLRDVSNLEFRDTTLAPAITERAIYADANSMYVNVPTGDTILLQINGVTHITVAAVNINFEGNNLLGINALTLTGIINFPDGVRQTFNPDATTAGINVGANTGDPSSTANGDVYYNSTANELRARIDDAWVDIGSGGAQTPWLSNIDADGFNLQDMGAIEFRIDTGNPGAGATYIQKAAVIQQFNVPTGHSYNFMISNVVQLTINNVQINMQNNALINAGIDGASNTITNINETQQTVSVGVAGTVLTSNGVGVAPTYQAGGSAQTPWLSNIDADGFNLQDLGAVEFRGTLAMFPAGTIQYIGADISGIRANVLTGDGFRFAVAGAIVASVFDNRIDFFGPSYQLRFSGAASRRIFNDQSGFIFEVETSDNFTYMVQDVNEYVFDSTEADFLGNNIRNVGFIESNAPGAPANGFIRITDGVRIQWRNQFETNDNWLRTLADVFEFHINSTEEYSFSATEADFNGNNLDNVGFISSNGADVADTGFIRMANAELIAWESSPSGADVTLGVDIGESLVLTGAANLRIIGGGVNLDINQSINFQNNINQSIQGNAGGIEYDTFVGDTHDFQIAGVSEYELNSTSLNMNNNNLGMGTGEIQFASSLRKISTDGTNLEISSGVAGAVELQVGAVNEYTFSATTADFGNNSITNVNGPTGIVFQSGEDIRADSLDLILGILAGGSVQLTVNSGVEYSFDVNSAGFNGNSIVDLASIDDSSGLAQLMFASVASAVNEFTITNAATGNPALLTATGETNAALTLATSGTGLITLNADTVVTGQFNLDAATELTIATGAITATKSYHSVDTEADAATDDLDTINGGLEGDILVIEAQDSARTVSVTEAGNIVLSATPFALDNVEDKLTLLYNGTNWHELSRSDNGA